MFGVRARSSPREGPMNINAGRWSSKISSRVRVNSVYPAFPVSGVTYFHIAEMALATLNDEELPIYPNYRLSISPATETVTQPSPVKPTLAVFLKSAQPHPLHLLNAQQLFIMFRRFGPLKKVTHAVPVSNNAHMASTLHYYSNKAIKRARDHLQTIMTENGWPDCGLQTHDPANLYIPVCKKTYNSESITLTLHRS
jgi:hypothetical protein